MKDSGRCHLSNSDTTKAKIRLITSMILFGTVGLIVRRIGLPSGLVSLLRGLLASLFLIAVIHRKGIRIDGRAIRSNLPALAFSGGSLGYMWVLLYEAYQRTTIAAATLSYYLAPLAVILLAAVLLKERLTVIKSLCVLTALAGMGMISGLLRFNSLQPDDLTGIGLGTGAAILYAGVTIINKQMKGIDSYVKTLIQLLFSALFILPYASLTLDLSQVHFTAAGVASLLVLSFVHTGLTYSLFFSSLGVIKAQTVAVLSYIDPLVSVIVSAVFLKESLGPSTYAGGALILGAALVSEVWDMKVRARIGA